MNIKRILEFKPRKYKNITGYKGVSKRNKTNKYEASLSLRIKGVPSRIHIGTFDTAETAYKERCKFIDNLK